MAPNILNSSFEQKKRVQKEKIPRVGATIFARKKPPIRYIDRRKGTDLWYKYKYTCLGTKRTSKNLWFNVKTENKEDAMFAAKDVEWMYGSDKEAPISILNFVDHGEEIPC